MTETPDPPEAPSAATAEAPVEEPVGQYWLRVHGYPAAIGEEIIEYADFFDPKVGVLKADPPELIKPGDCILFYADGPASLYAVGKVLGPPELLANSAESGRQGRRWKLPIQPQSVILAMNKAAHAVGLRPPSGWHFLRAARAHTFIRLPDEDGPYLVEQVRSRASTKGE